MIPHGVRSNLKMDQMKALNEVSSHAIQSNDHGCLNHNAMKKKAFGYNNPFVRIKLLGAIGSVLDYDPEHDMLSAVIRYFTPYHNANNQPLLLPVALGETMAVNTILSNIVIRKWKLVLNFDPILIKSTIPKEMFDVVYESTRRTSTQLTPSRMDPTSASIAQSSMLRTVSGEEEMSTSNDVLYNS